MTIGCLGEVPIEVSAETMRTISNFVWSGDARYATHQRAANYSLTEFTGNAPDKITFDIVISAYLGVNPMEEISRLLEYKRQGKAVTFVLGNHGYGIYRWNVLSVKTKVDATDGDGDITQAVASVTLQEYLRD